MKKLIVVSITTLLILTLILAPTIAIEQSFAKQSKASSAVEKKIESKLESLVKNDYTKYCGVWVKYKPLVNNTVTAYNGSANCSGITPPNPPGPNPNPLPVKIPLLNPATTFRIASAGDQDCNAAQIKEYDLANFYSVQVMVLPGDYNYNDGACVLTYFPAHNYRVINSTSSTAVVSVGNHDKCSDVMKFMKQTKCWYHFTAAGGKVEFFVIDSNSPFGPGSNQYNDMKSWIASSKAQYKIVVIHHPFITVASTHPKNGQFENYQPLFIQYNVTLVLEAHNHNWQHFIIDNVEYDVTGTGTHDQGNKIYPTKSSDDGLGHKVIQSYADQNGITIYDFNIANNTRAMNMWFVNNNNNVLYPTN